jgi:outer membrane murein-binding lipoprotein Lpp
MTEIEKNILQLGGCVLGGLLLCGVVSGVVTAKNQSDSRAYFQQQQQADAEREQRIQQTTELLNEGKEATRRAFPELTNP